MFFTFLHAMLSHFCPSQSRLGSSTLSAPSEKTNMNLSEWTSFVSSGRTVNDQRLHCVKVRQAAVCLVPKQTRKLSSNVKHNVSRSTKLGLCTVRKYTRRMLRRGNAVALQKHEGSSYQQEPGRVTTHTHLTVTQLHWCQETWSAQGANFEIRKNKEK